MNTQLKKLTSPHKFATIKDVADQAGVSKMTASAVLSGRQKNVRFSETTRQRVQEAAHSLNYYPSAIARGMTQKRMNVMGVVLPAQGISLVNDPYVCGLLDSIMAVNMHRQQNTTVFTGQIWSDVQQNMPVFCDGRCDGLIIISPRLGSPLIPALIKRQMPFVLINGLDDDPHVSSVTINNRQAMRRLVEYVIGQGHRRIALLGASHEGPSASERLAGYREALQDTGIEYDPQIAFKSVSAKDRQSISEVEWLIQNMDSPPQERPTALCCFNDKLAIEASAALRSAGLRVPEDVSITGFDDITEAAAHDPPLTTVHMPTNHLGQRAAEILLSQIDAGNLLGQKEVLPTEMVIRRSVASPFF